MSNQWSKEESKTAHRFWSVITLLGILIVGLLIRTALQEGRASALKNLNDEEMAKVLSQIVARTKASENGTYLDYVVQLAPNWEKGREEAYTKGRTDQINYDFAEIERELMLTDDQSEKLCEFKHRFLERETAKKKTQQR